MSSIRKFFKDFMTTRRTNLGCISGVDQDQSFIGAFCLISNESGKLSPSYIRNTFVNASMSMDHFVNRQILHTDRVERLYYTITLLMGKVIAFIRDSFMDLSYNFPGFSSLRSAFIKLRKFSLSFSQRFFFVFKESGVINLDTVRERSERFKTHIYTDRSAGFKKWIFLDNTRKSDIPLTSSRLFYTASLNLTCDIPMEFDFDSADFREFEPLFSNLKTELRERERVVPVKPFKSWITRFISSLNPSKECFERKIEPNKNILKDLRMNIFKTTSQLFSLYKKRVLGIITQTFIFDFPTFFTLFKKVIIQPAAFFKPHIHNVSLFARWIYTEFICFKHSYSMRLKNKMSIVSTIQKYKNSTRADI